MAGRAAGAGAGADDLVRDLLTASGGTFAAPESNFYQVERDTLVLTENVAQAFLGIRLQCAQCHNHPFDRWTQDDYYGYAAFFAQVGRKQAEDPREQVIFDRGGGNVRHPVTNRPVEPRRRGDRAIPDDVRDRRAVLASGMVLLRTRGSHAPRPTACGRSSWGAVSSSRWTTSGSPTPRPCRACWMRSPSGSSPRTTTRARWSGRSAPRGPTSAPRSRPLPTPTIRTTSSRSVRRLRAETLLDAICQVTDDPEKHRGLPLGARAVQIADGATTNHFLRVFGRSERKSVCACESTTDPSLSQALHLLNGQSVHDKIRKGGLVEGRLAEGAAPLDVARALFVRCLVREAERPPAPGRGGPSRAPIHARSSRTSSGAC